MLLPHSVTLLVGVEFSPWPEHCRYPSTHLNQSATHRSRGSGVHWPESKAQPGERSDLG